MLKKKSRRSITPETPMMSPKKQIDQDRVVTKGRVRFSSESTQLKVIPRRTPLEQRECWFTAHDYACIKRRNQAAINSAKNGMFFETEYETIRGLEKFIWFAPNEKQQRRKATIGRILSEQKRQKALGINDPSMIKVLSSIYSNWEKDKALELAAEDETGVLETREPKFPSFEKMVVVANCVENAIEAFASNAFERRTIWL